VGWRTRTGFVVSSYIDCDLYLATPISRLVSSKLIESNERRTKPHQIIETLEAQIDFLDIRQLANNGQLSFGDVLKIRNRARPFGNGFRPKQNEIETLCSPITMRSLKPAVVPESQVKL